MTQRIGYLTYGLDRAPTGIGRYAVEVLRALAALPDCPEVVLLTTEQEDRFGLWDRFEHYPLPGCRRLPALMSIGHLALSQAIRRYRLDLVHDPNGIAPFLGPHAGAGRIVTIHDAFAYTTPAAHNWVDNWRYHWQLPSAARRADAVITVSECSRRDLMRYLGLAAEHVYVITEGVDPHFRSVAEAERQTVLARYGISQPYLLYVGGINARKNIARLFEAYARVRERHPGIKLVVGGKRQWQTAEIDAAFLRNNLVNDVYFTGYIADTDLPAIYSAAEAFVFPSLYEGFGLPPLEAMACATPVVTSNISALPEVVGDAALTIDPYDTNALAVAIERVLTDKGLRATLRRRGIQHVTRFTWEQTARATLKLYQRVVLAADQSRARHKYTSIV